MRPRQPGTPEHAAWNVIQLIGAEKGGSLVGNPPFSKSEEFITRLLEYGFRKVICFQRFAWWESQKRRDFWDKYPPSRVYVCGSRATCWRVGLPEEDKKSSTTTAHGFFVFEEGHHGTQLLRLYKGDAA